MIVLSKEQVIKLHEQLITATILALASGKLEASDIQQWIIQHQK